MKWILIWLGPFVLVWLFMIGAHHD